MGQKKDIGQGQRGSRRERKKFERNAKGRRDLSG